MQLVTRGLEDVLQESIAWMGTQPHKVFSLETCTTWFLHCITRSTVGSMPSRLSTFCKSCQKETTQHLFFHCPQVNSQWLKLLHLTESTSLDFGPVGSLMDILTIAVKYQVYSPTRLILVAELLWAAWTDRNQLVFQEVLRQTPLW
jgi:hypothetical protein